MKKNNKLVVRVTKQIKFEKKLVSFIYSFAAVLLIACLICCFFLLSTNLSIKSDVKSINSRIDKIESSIAKKEYPSTDDMIILYYRELSEKTDDAIDRILTIVGLLAAIVSFFGLLLSFRAPQNITEQISQVRNVGEKANEAAENAQYQLAIFVAVNFDSNNDTSNFSRVDKLSKVIITYPSQPDAYIMRARIYEQLGQQFEQQDINRSSEYYQLAIGDYSIAMALGANVGDCNNNIGIIYTELGESQEALKYYNKAIKENNNDKMFFVNRGTCYEMLGEYHKSLNDFAQAILLDIAEASAYYGRSYTYDSLWRKENDDKTKRQYIQKEIDDLNKAYDLDPSYQSAIDRLNSLCKELEQLGIPVN